MRFIETKTHGILDYLTGILLILSPWIFDFNEGGAETIIPVVLGAGVIMYSLLTDYEMGGSYKITMKTHLLLDFAGGALLATSPWIFGFNDDVWQPHLIIGSMEMLVSVCTKTTRGTSGSKRRHASASH
ncbi:MAG: hypothetical protein ACJ75F_05070 [Flavisolibacter sp.]